MEKRTQASAGSQDPDWVLESLVVYLSGPLWLAPILNFMEQKSVVFESETDHEEYFVLHGQFRNMVDFMLGAYMEDLGLQPHHLERALGRIKPSVRSAALQSALTLNEKSGSLHGWPPTMTELDDQDLMEPVRAAGHYETFKRLMFAKNVQMHRQALEMLQRRPRDARRRGGDAQLADLSGFSEEEINEAIRQSLAELERKRTADALEERDLERALVISVRSTLPTAPDDDDDDDDGKAPSPVETEASRSPRSKRRPSPSPADVERRRALLKAQRDKLLQMKQRERQEQLQSVQEEALRSKSNGGSGGGGGGGGVAAARPRSGLAAQRALAGDAAANQVDERTIQYRRLLLQKIKEEVAAGGQS